MPTVTLTARNVFKLASPEKGRIEYFDDNKKFPGFGLRVTEKGARSWILLYRRKGIQRRYTIDSLDDNQGLAWARNKAKEALREIANGKDPAAKKRHDREAKTVEALAKLYITEYAKPNKRTWRADANILNKDVIPWFSGRKAVDVTRTDIRDLLKEIAGRGSPIQSNRTFEVVRKMFNWAIGEDISPGLEHNPCDYVKKVAKERRRERVLSDDEIRAVWNALATIDDTLANVYRLLFMTAARKAEVTEMEWQEIDGAWWILPAARSKNGRPHRVYLTEAARAVFDGMAKPDARSGRVFPSRGKSGLLWGVYDEHPELLQASGTAGWTLHDIRRTVASNLGKLGFSRFIQDRILNHVDKGIGSVYDLYSYDREREQALTAWGSRLEEIVSGKAPAGNVVALPAARSA